MYQKALTLFLALVAVSFLGYGITGFYTLDLSQPACQVDSDCTYSVCCGVYGQSYGVCDQEDQCAGIYLASRAAAVDVKETQSAPVLQQAPEVNLQAQASQSYIALALGIFILFVIGVISYVEWKQHKDMPMKKIKRAKK